MERASLRPHAVGVLILLGVQFLAGTILNLFVQLPASHPGTTGGGYFGRSWASLLWALSDGGGWPLVVHASLAVILFLVTLALFVRTLVRRERGWRWGTGVAWFFTLGALFNGLSFTDYGEDANSMIMASCWLVVVIALVIVLLAHPASRVRRT